MKGKSSNRNATRKRKGKATTRAQERGGAKAKDLIVRIEKERGFRRRWHKILAETDPELLRTIHNTTVGVLSRRKRLPQWVKELIIIGIDAATFWPGIRAHINSALELGITKEQIVEALEATYVAAGIHAAAFGLEMLDDTLKARAKGRIDELIY